MTVEEVQPSRSVLARAREASEAEVRRRELKDGIFAVIVVCEASERSS